MPSYGGFLPPANDCDEYYGQYSGTYKISTFGGITTVDATGTRGGGMVGATSEEEQQKCKPSCVFNVFDYLDGDRHDACYYYEMAKNKLGREPLPNGGMNTDDIPAIGSYGGGEVKEIDPDTVLIDSRTGKTIEGNVVLLGIKRDGIGHLVVLKRILFRRNKKIKYYYDPTNNEYGVTKRQFVMFEVKE